MSVRRIEDHRPLLARLRELAPQSELLALSKRFVDASLALCTRKQSAVKFIELTFEIGTNGGGQGQGNGTAGRA